ncbi:MAG: hypothetical protein HYZ10_09610 [Ignavibacteriales bacterium]|nr:hypothetical protein [Ignavibacteriales bacterium]
MQTLNKLLLVILLLIVITPIHSLSQKKYEKDFYGGLFSLSDYIASDEFLSIKKITTDLEQVDIIYSKAVNFFEGDISEALLCLTFSCLPFNKIDFNLLLGIVKVPLPSPPKIVFQKRLENLPKNIYFNSPRTNFGDKDKLSHFFGNAFLRYNISMFNFSKFMGIFVEKTEESFFANGELDRRDIMTNHLGELFAEMLKLYPEAKPSKALLVYQIFYFREGL